MLTAQSSRTLSRHPIESFTAPDRSASSVHTVDGCEPFLGCSWVCPYFSCCDLYVLFVLFEWLTSRDRCGRAAAIFWGVASWICSKKDITFLHSSHQVFFSIHVVPPKSSIEIVTTWKKFCFISSEISELHMINTLSIEFSIFAWFMLIYIYMCVCVCVCVEKVKTKENYMFGGSFIVPTRFDFKIQKYFIKIISYIK